MPGKDSYGPGGKWIHDRAHRIMEEGKTQDEYGAEKGKQVAYAIATQQAHKTGKSPKDFRTSAGVREAKQKYDEPKSEYQKTAMMEGFLDELVKIGGHYSEVITDALGVPGAGLAQWLQTRNLKDAAKSVGGSALATGVGFGIERAASPWTDELAKKHPGLAAMARFGLVAAPEAVNLGWMARRNAARIAH